MTAVLLTRSRGKALEAEHCGSLAVVDLDGAVLFSAGNIERLFYPRSTAKLFHALPFLETGAAKAFQCSPEEIALAAASHSGEVSFVEALKVFAERLGLRPEDIVCGPDTPLAPKVAARLSNEGILPTVFHNNNAGKHLSVLATCLHCGEDRMGYQKLEHPAIQRLVRALEIRCDVSCNSAEAVIDNCGLPTWPISTRALALGMARLGAGARTHAESAEARLIASIRSAPEYFGGSKRFSTLLLRATEGTVLAKGGSEGVFAVTLPDRGLGIVIKINDGSGEAASAVLVELLSRMGCLPIPANHPLRERVNIWRKEGQPERSMNLGFPAFQKSAAVVPWRAGPTPHQAAPTVRHRGKEFIDAEGRQFVDTPFRYGVLRHRNLTDDAVDELIRFVCKSMEEVAAYLGTEAASDVIIQIVGRDNRSMTFLTEKRIRISEMRVANASCLHHELTHLLAGPSLRGAIFTEGLAVHVQSLFGGPDDRSYPTSGRDLHTLAKALLTMETGASSQLSMEANGAASADEDSEERRKDYILCGSFIRLMIERIGVPTLMQIYKTADNSPIVSALELEWRQELGSV